MSKDEILPCPFCGNIGKLIHDFPTDNSRDMEYRVVCPWNDCLVGPETYWDIFPSAAIAAWNHRTNNGDYERLIAAAKTVWPDGLNFGCDTADHLADEILELRAEISKLKS